MKFCKWVAKNEKLISVVVAVIEALLAFMLFPDLLSKIWGTIFVGIASYFINLAIVQFAKVFLLIGAVNALEKNGDPEPMLSTTQELLEYKNTDVMRCTYLIDKSLALRELGQLCEARDILVNIRIEETRGVTPHIKLVYYNNLSDIFDLLGDYERAEIWYQKMLQIYNGMKESKLKRSLRKTYLFQTATHCFRMGDDEQSAILLDQVESNVLKDKVELALLRALLCVRANRMDEARGYLQEIIATGNKLYAVQLAHKMLDDIKSCGNA